MAYPEVKLSLREKVGYALGDTAANITWRGVSTFLLIFYTDVFGISAPLWCSGANRSRLAF